MRTIEKIVLGGVLGYVLATFTGGCSEQKKETPVAQRQTTVPVSTQSVCADVTGDGVEDVVFADTSGLYFKPGLWKENDDFSSSIHYMPAVKISNLHGLHSLNVRNILGDSLPDILAVESVKDSFVTIIYFENYGHGKFGPGKEQIIKTTPD